MIHLTASEYQALARGSMADKDIELLARALVDEAHHQGKVLTIDQRPLVPLAMGHYETTIQVREARARA